ncbi:MAG TPA: cupin domain-containing protein [Opitutaceae bacterium]|jgi:uncharacterized cupin superfamily protein
MKKVNMREVKEEPWASPKGKFASADRCISVALGREADSTDMAKRHPFDVEVCRIPAGKAACPFHSHSAQWEFYHVISGRGSVRHSEGVTPISEGDAFIFGPGEAHQLASAPDSELTVYIVADNPLGETCHYPDSGKWLVRSPQRGLIRSAPLDYLDGEE